MTLCMAFYVNCLKVIISLMVLQLAERPLLYRKSWSLNTLVVLDFKPEVEMWRFCACAVKNGRNQP